MTDDTCTTGTEHLVARTRGFAVGLGLGALFVDHGGSTVATTLIAFSFVVLSGYYAYRNLYADTDHSEGSDD